MCSLLRGAAGRSFKQEGSRADLQGRPAAALPASTVQCNRLLAARAATREGSAATVAAVASHPAAATVQLCCLPQPRNRTAGTARPWLGVACSSSAAAAHTSCLPLAARLDLQPAADLQGVVEAGDSHLVCREGAGQLSGRTEHPLRVGDLQGDSPGRRCACWVGRPGDAHARPRAAGTAAEAAPRRRRGGRTPRFCNRRLAQSATERAEGRPRVAAQHHNSTQHFCTKTLSQRDPAPPCLHVDCGQVVQVLLLVGLVHLILCRARTIMRVRTWGQLQYCSMETGTGQGAPRHSIKGLRAEGGRASLGHARSARSARARLG